MPAFVAVLVSAFVFHDYGGLLPALAHRQDIGHPCIDGNGSGHSGSLRNEAQDIFDPCILLCASIGVSYQHNGGSQGIVHPHGGILQHVAEGASAAVGDEELVAYLILVRPRYQCFHFQHFQVEWQ